MTRLLSFAILLSVALAPVAAQSTAGWKVRADRSTSATDPDAAGKIQFTAMGKGFHAVNPQAAVYWNPANAAKGPYTLKGTFTLNEPSGHTNYYGLVFGGSSLEGANQAYQYFLIAQDGTFLVKRRTGDAKTDDVVAKTANAAIKKPEANGKSTNVLEVRVLADKVDYAVNGTVVGSSPKAGMTTDGIWGIRVNHLLNVTIDEIGVGK
ncbi:MAG TPA: hypothetical protein VM820_19485 [Vicinamibacterales bacterium]|jgi:hypothetical protein|nr:hypothetical protein [Vicinamibacterales bacterium]